ncbi:MAG: hypothetical protein DLM70_00935, partial [Chloroflexi bacterium]
FTDLEVGGDSATVRGYERKTLKTLIKTGRGARSLVGDSVITFSDHLVRTPDGWRIDSEYLDYAPGQQRP